MHTDRRTRIWAMIETPIALFNVRPIAAAATDSETRLTGFVIGTNDLAKETRARIVPGRAPMLPWLTTCSRPRASTASTFSTASTTISATPRALRPECAQARDMGFDGKTLIHPNQIAPCNARLLAERRRGRAGAQMIAAFDPPENSDKGVVQLDGRMVERLHAEMARRTVAIAEAIAERG